VRDTGPGVAPEVIAQLFEPFVTTKASGHLGLGLALCRELVRAQRGGLQVASVAGQGATVTLSFPSIRNEGERGAGS
jgi:signal transduction histidine kinase